jgi:two-component system, OmpR family, sensor histidine kinase BaeS
LKTNEKSLIGMIKSHWIYKILAAFIAVVLVGSLVNVITMRFSFAPAFERHMGRMGEAMQGMMGGGTRSPNLFGGFQAAVNDSLLISSIVAFFVAVLAALLISRLITRPIKRLTQASREIARGEYNHRIPEDEIPDDELGQLADSFNRMAEKLDGIESMRRQLIGDISHELRTPLTAIKGSMEGLMDGVLPAEKSTYQQIYREADRLQRLVEDLQELSRVDGSTLRLNKKEVNVSDLVQAAVTPLENTFTMQGIELKTQVEDNLPSVSVDSDRIQQVLHNLLGNALRFTHENGHVLLDVHREGKQILFSVADDGIGISPEHLPHIFERFYRADKSRSRANGGGSGIGLTIAKSLVEAHGGKIWVESPGKEQGSKFLFTIPLG